MPLAAPVAIILLLILSGAWAGQITRKSLGGGLTGILIAVLVLALFFTIDSPAAGAAIAVIVLTLPWFQTRHFLMESPTDRKRLWVLKFFKILSITCLFGLSVSCLFLHEIGVIRIAPLVLLIIYFTSRIAFSAILWGTGVLIIASIIGLIAHHAVSTPNSAPFKLRLERSTDENAMDRSRRLFALADTIAGLGLPLNISDTFVPSAEIKATIDSGLPIIEEIQTILSEGPLAYPWPERLDLESLPRNYFSWLTISKVMVLKSQGEVLRNHPEMAAHTIAGVFHLGRELRNSRGPLIHYIVGVAILNVGCGAAKHWLTHAKHSANGLDIISEAVRESMDDRDGLRHSMAAEFEFGKGGIRDLLNGQTPLWGNGSPAQRSIQKVLLPVVLDERASMDLVEQNLIRSLDNDSSPPPTRIINPTNIVGEWLFEISSPVEIWAIKASADANLKGIALVLQARASGSSFTHFWNALSPEEKRNPYTGQPFAIVDSHLVVTQENTSIAYPL